MNTYWFYLNGKVVGQAKGENESLARTNAVYEAKIYDRESLPFLLDEDLTAKRIYTPSDKRRRHEN